MRKTTQMLQETKEYGKGVKNTEIRYSLSPEEIRQQIACSAESVTMTEFLEPVSRLLGFTCRKNVFSPIVRDWLTKEGYMARRDSTGDAPLLTSRGAASGLWEKLSESGSSMVIYCNGQGQQFLLDNLEQILAFERKRWADLEACLTPEFISSISCGEITESPTKFLNRINDRLPSGLFRKFTAADVNIWLVRQKLLEDILVKEEWWRVPTEAGEAVGIEPITLNDVKRDGSRWSLKGKKYILTHLRDIAESLGTGTAYQLVPLCFSVSEEMRSGFTCAERDLTNKNITEWLNAWLETAAGVRFPKGLIPAWLADRGFLTRMDYSEEYVSRNMRRTILVPTEQGKAIGLMMKNGEGYTFLTYRQEAQQYIIQHLEEIAAFWQRKF